MCYVNTSDIYLQSTCELQPLIVIPRLEHGNVFEIGSEIICDFYSSCHTGISHVCMVDIDP